MTPIYRFEEELTKKYDFEPFLPAYHIDDLRESDREELSGMLYGLYNTLHFFDNESEINEEQKTLGQLKNEYLEELKERFEKCFLCNVHDFVVSCLDSYEAEGSDE